MRLFIISLAVIVAACYADTLLVETFDAPGWTTNNPPAGWRIVHGDTYQRLNDWHRRNANAAPWTDHPSPFPAIMVDLPQDSSPDIIMSPAISTANHRNVVLTCSTYFSHRQANGYSAQIRYSVDNGRTFPYLVRDYYTQNVGPAVLESFSLSSTANRRDSLVIGWIFSGDLFGINWWAFDDVCLTADSILQYDVRTRSIIDPQARILPGNLTPTARYRNIGSVDQYDVPVYCELYDTPGGTLLQSWNTTIDTLRAFDTETTAFFNPPYAVTNGSYYIRFWHSAPDSNPANDTIDRSFLVSDIIEYRKDDGGVSAHLTWPVGHYGWASRFDIPGIYYIESLKVWLNGPAQLRNRRYQLAIARDSSGQPGRFIYKSPVLYAAAGAGWNTLYLGAAGDELLPGASFYVVYLQCGEPPECPGLGEDGTLDSTGSYWEYRNGTYRAATPPGDLMIRVLINTNPIIPPQFDVRTVFVATPAYEVVHRPYNQQLTLAAVVQNSGLDPLADVAVACTVKNSTGGIVVTSSYNISSLLPGVSEYITFPDRWVPDATEPCSVIVNTMTSSGQAEVILTNNDKRFTCDVWKGIHTGRSTGRNAWIDSDTTDGPTFSWIDTTNAGVVISTAEDQHRFVPIGFAFPFNDTAYQNVHVCDNGWFNLGYDPGTNATGPDTVPNTAAPNIAFYGWWRDLRFGPYAGNGRVYYKNVGTAPNRQFVLIWMNGTINGADTANKISFEAVLNENGTVVWQYLDTDCGNLEYDNARSASIGFEDATGTDGVNYLYSVPPLSTSRNGLANRVRPGLAVKFYHETRDAAVTDIKTPDYYVFPETLYPQVLVQNYGTVRDTIRAYITITPGLYTDTFIVANLAPDAETLVSFARPWYADSGTFTAICTVAMTDDERPANNIFSRVFSVSPWVQRQDIPFGWTRRRVKEASLAYSPFTNKIYALKGSNTNELWGYDVTTGTWESLASMPLSPSGSKCKDGCDLAFDAYHGTRGWLWAIKGGGRTDFYSYDIASNTWVQRPSVTAPAFKFRAPRKGASIAYVPARGPQGSVYCIPGNNSVFMYRFDVDSAGWDTCLDVPKKFVNPKSVKAGADMVFNDDSSLLYVMKGNNTAEVYPYRPSTGEWGTMLDDVSLLGLRNRRVKAGGSMTYLGNQLYVLKGGNRQEFWTYEFNGRDSWRQRSDIPIAISGRRVKPKRGSAMVAVGNSIFCLKGSYVNEFWEYRPATDRRSLFGDAPLRDGIMAGPTGVVRPALMLGMNPVSGAARIGYSLPASGAARLAVYDATGSLVRVLVDAAIPSGNHYAIWDGRSRTGRPVSAGVYFVKLETGNAVLSRKLVLQR